MKDVILIIAAMEDVELDYLISKLKNLKKIEYKHVFFYEGNMFDKNIVFCVSGIGTINMAVALTIAINKYNPKIVINEGVSGGYTKDIKKEDIVIGIDAIDITSMEHTGTGNTLEDYTITTFLYGEENRLIIPKADEKLIDFIRKNFSDENLHFRQTRKWKYLE